VIDWLQPVLGFVSASLVALIALAFGAMFLLFSGSAALVLAQFLPFSRRPAVTALALAGGAAVTGVAALAAGAPFPWLPPLVQLGCGVVVTAVDRARFLHRPLRFGLGALFVASGLAWIAALWLPAVAPFARLGVLATAVALGVGVLGLWPLVVAGLIGHAHERPVEWFLSLRYLVAKRRQTFISIITVICVVGVALGVAVIMTVLSVMNGFSRMWEEKILGNRAHFAIQSRLGPYEQYAELRERILRVPGVTGATPFLYSNAVLRGEAGDIRAVILKGIDPRTVGEATELREDLVEGSLENLAPEPGAQGTERLPGVIVGWELANEFLLRVGDPLILISPLGGARTPLGPAPRLERFRVAGVFRADFFQFDETFLYTDLAGAQGFMKLPDVVSGIEVRTEDAYRSREIAERTRAALGGPFFARDWKDLYPGVFQALKGERVMMFVLLSFIMVVAGFIIVATLIMMIMEKSRDIAILKTMGCDDDAVLRVFAMEGVLIGVGGLALGLAMGLVITWNLDRIQSVVERILGFDVLPIDVYQLDQVPFEVVPLQVAIIAGIAMVLSIGATLLPSWQAARLDPAEALRYE
jgi:lipoprotein-releasing system permease protein